MNQSQNSLLGSRGKEGNQLDLTVGFSRGLELKNITHPLHLPLLVSVISLLSRSFKGLSRKAAELGVQLGTIWPDVPTWVLLSPFA